MSLFPQAKRQGVEYLPVPYRYKEPRREERADAG